MHKTEEVNIRSSADLDDEVKTILALIKNNSGLKMGELYKLYQEKGGAAVYKTFARKIKRLEEGNFVLCDKVEGGPDGNFTVVTYAKTKKLTDF